MVIAGRSLPNPSSNYALHFEHYSLQPIKEISAYIDYCQKRSVLLDEQTIEVLAYGFDYVPGMFTDFVHPKFVKAEPVYG